MQPSIWNGRANGVQYSGGGGGGGGGGCGGGGDRDSRCSEQWAMKCSRWWWLRVVGIVKRQ